MLLSVPETRPVVEVTLVELGLPQMVLLSELLAILAEAVVLSWRQIHLQHNQPQGQAEQLGVVLSVQLGVVLELGCWAIQFQQHNQPRLLVG